MNDWCSYKTVKQLRYDARPYVFVLIRFEDSFTGDERYIGEFSVASGREFPEFWLNSREFLYGCPE